MGKTLHKNILGKKKSNVSSLDKNKYMDMLGVSGNSKWETDYPNETLYHLISEMHNMQTSTKLFRQSLMIKYSIVYIHYIPKYIQIIQEKENIKSQNIWQSNIIYTQINNE